MEINDEHLKRIGRIAVEFGHLEWLVGNTFVGLMDDVTGEILAEAVDGVEKRRHLIMKLMVKRFPAMVDEWRECSEKIVVFQGQRNAIVHSAWLVESGMDMVGIPNKGEARAYSPSDLDEVAESIRQMNVKIVGILGKIIAASMEDRDNLS